MFLKSIFCKHNYKLYNIDTYLNWTARFFCYKYICPNCRKETTLYSLDLEREIKQLENLIAKKEALNDVDFLKNLNKNSEFVMMTLDYLLKDKVLYKGKHIHLLKKRYLDKGIDLNEITSAVRRIK